MRWNDAFKLAEQYYTEHGDLLVPLDYVVGGYSLGRWIEWQRRRHSSAQKQYKSEEKQCEGSSCVPLTQEQISRLDSIGMVWNLKDYEWNRSFAVAEAYYKEHGNLVVPTDYCVDGVNLSSWIRTQRRIRNGKLKDRKTMLSDERIRRLDSIGMTWGAYDARWERSFAVAEKYYREHGDLNVPAHYEVDGVDLSRWVWLQRRIVNGKHKGTGRKLTEEQVQRLEAIGMSWDEVVVSR